MKRIGFIILYWSLFVISQVPPHYYDAAQGLTGDSLKKVLYEIISSNVTVLSYSALWNAYKKTDVKPNGKIWDIYSDIPGGTPPYEYTPGTDQCGNYNSEGDCYNREHTIPASWFNDQSPMYTDLFIVLPTDGYVNNKRSDYPYGQVSSPTWTSMNGSKLGLSSFSGYTGTVFMPIDSFKGDVARIYFYACVRYMDKIQNWSSPVFVGNDLAPWAEDLFLQWHQLDPVSTKERMRNDSVYKIQGNRNPFVDNPSWVFSIWGPTASLSESAYPTVFVYPNPAESDVHISGVNNNEGTFYVLSIDGKLILTTHETTLNVSQWPAGIYFLKITTNNGEVMRKIIIQH
jgi:endonuclease I